MPSALEAAIRPNTRLIWIETPSNPLLKLIDLEAVAAIARKRGIWSAADNTFATPWIQRPLESGFDLVVHSTTKYLNGHSDMVGGVAVVGENAELRERLAFLQNSVGAVSGPFDSFLALARPQDAGAADGAAMRVGAAHRRNGWSATRRCDRVFYPGLASHPQHALARGRCAHSAA